ncbi:MAG TPA: phosphodiester glycosidase family protein [Chitinophagaceae bacterium]|nr:phosphodiester glycosidase family protein [Chitinophagaceae bacterium]
MKKTFSALITCFIAMTMAFPVSGQDLHLDRTLMSRMIKDTSFKIVPGVTETNLRYLNTAGKPMAVYILRVNLKLKHHPLSIEATTPFNRDTFCRQTVMEQMKWENTPGHKVVAGVNAGFFNMKNGEPITMEIKEGKKLKDAVHTGRGFVGVLKNGKIIIGDSLLYERKKKKLKGALGGYPMLVKDGKPLPQLHDKFSLTRHPRTAAGITRKGQVFFVVVDGRQPAYGNGMPLEELAHLMTLLGARKAINLDGGGSSTMVTADTQTGKWINRNKPSGKRERAVANAWIVVSK